MKEVKELLSTSMDHVRDKVLNYRLQDLRDKVISHETLRVLKEELFEWSKSDVSLIDTTSPVIYGELLKQFIIEQKDLWVNLPDDYELNEYYGLSYDQAIIDLLENDYFHFLDEFNHYARQHVERVKQECDNEKNAEFKVSERG